MRVDLPCRDCGRQVAWNVRDDLRSMIDLAEVLRTVVCGACSARGQPPGGAIYIACRSCGRLVTTTAIPSPRSVLCIDCASPQTASARTAAQLVASRARDRSPSDSDWRTNPLRTVRALADLLNTPTDDIEVWLSPSAETATLTIRAYVRRTYAVECVVSDQAVAFTRDGGAQLWRETVRMMAREIMELVRPRVTVTSGTGARVETSNVGMASPALTPGEAVGRGFNGVLQKLDGLIDALQPTPKPVLPKRALDLSEDDEP